jgi:hypothetical protein
VKQDTADFVDGVQSAIRIIACAKALISPSAILRSKRPKFAWLQFNEIRAHVRFSSPQTFRESMVSRNPEIVKVGRKRSCSAMFVVYEAMNNKPTVEQLSTIGTIVRAVSAAVRQSPAPRKNKT